MRTSVIAGLVLILALSASVVCAEDTDNDKSTVEFSGGLTVTSEWTTADVPFWIRLRNNTDVALTGLRFQAVGQDVNISALCTPFRADTAKPVCTVGDPIDIPARSERVLNGTVRVSTGGEHHLALLAMSPGGLEISTALGTLSVLDGWTALGMVRDAIAWPVLGSIVVFLYKRWSDEREHRQEAMAKQLADNRARRDKAAAEHAETVRIMLPIVHNYAVRFYSEIAAAYRSFYASARAYQDAVKDHDQSRADLMLAMQTFSFLKLHLRNRELGQQVGGFYLSTLVAEQILVKASTLWDQDLFPDPEHAADRAVTTLLDALQHLPASAGQTEFDRDQATRECSARMLNRNKFVDFLGTFTTADLVPQAYACLEDRLKRWSIGNPSTLSYAWLGGEVMKRETDMLFAQWYGEEPAITGAKEHEEICRAVCRGLGDDEQKGLKYLGLA